MTPYTTDEERRFLARFMARGWLAREREDAFELRAVNHGLSDGLLRADRSEAKFTAAGRRALQPYL